MEPLWLNKTLQEECVSFSVQGSMTEGVLDKQYVDVHTFFNPSHLGGKAVGLKTDTHSPCLPPELPERHGQQHLSLQVPQRSHSSASSSEENSSSSAALPLLAGERDSPSPSTEERVFPMNGKSPAEWVAHSCNLLWSKNSEPQILNSSSYVHVLDIKCWSFPSIYFLSCLLNAAFSPVSLQHPRGSPRSITGLTQQLPGPLLSALTPLLSSQASVLCALWSPGQHQEPVGGRFHR